MTEPRVKDHIWACDGPLVPERHTQAGTCTKSGRGYTYGFQVEQKGIASGFSGGGAYDLEGRLLGIVAQTGTNDLGQDVAYLYHIGDLRRELNF